MTTTSPATALSATSSGRQGHLPRARERQPHEPGPAKVTCVTPADRQSRHRCDRRPTSVPSDPRTEIHQRPARVLPGLVRCCTASGRSILSFH